MDSLQAPELAEDEAIAIWGRVIRGFRATQQLIHAKLKERFELTEAEVETLLELHRRPELRARHASLSKVAGFTAGGFTKIADKLSRRGLTMRTACDTDRRVSYLQLTEEGAALAAEVTSLTAQLNRDYFIDVLGVERAQQVSGSMTALYRASLVRE